MLACVACSMLWMANWLAHVQSLRALDCQRTAVKTIRNSGAPKNILCFKIPIHDFHKQDNLFHRNSTCTCCNLRYQCYNYWSHTTMQTKVFASVRNSYRASQLAIETHSFLSKLYFQVPNKGINIILGIIQIFKQLRSLWFFRNVCDLYRQFPA